MVEDVGSLPGPRKPTMMNSAARPARPKPTKRRDNDGPPRRTRIVVLLNSKPRDYCPGTGPPLQRPRLLPPQDSTAYIVDRILLPSPGLASNGKPMPKRMTYIIGWNDLPAARLLVPAMRILDYVSPYVLEEWEWKLEQELEEERFKLMEESKVEGLKEKLTSATSKAGTRQKRTKKRVKPPVHSQIEAAAVVNLETEAQAAAGPAKGVMSLSTPQKARLEEFEELSEEDSTPSRQVQAELLASQRKKQRQVTTSPQATLQPSAEDVPPAGTMPLVAPPTPSNGFHAVQRNTPLPSLRPDPPAYNHAFPLSFTPIGYGRQAPSVSSSPFDLPEVPFEDTPSEKPKKRRKMEKLQGESEDDGEPAWEVQRLEGMEWFDVEGRGLTRYFKVRWEGDWPPDQNPSWEPEENIPGTLVRNYLKNPKRSAKKARQARPTAKGKSDTLPWAPVRKYSSVSEAFAAGDEGDDAMDLVGGHHYSGYNYDRHDNDLDELFVVAEDAGHGR